MDWFPAPHTAVQNTEYKKAVPVLMKKHSEVKTKTDRNQKIKDVTSVRDGEGDTVHSGQITWC